MAIVDPIIDREGYERWVCSRPPRVRQMLRSHPPDRLYRMSSTGHRVTIYSYCEDGTVTVDVTGEYNRVAFNRRVFSIDPADLTECDLPAPDEKLGTALSPDEAKEYLARMREEDPCLDPRCEVHIDEDDDR